MSTIVTHYESREDAHFVVELQTIDLKLKIKRIVKGDKIKKIKKRDPKALSPGDAVYACTGRYEGDKLFFAAWNGSANTRFKDEQGNVRYISNENVIVFWKFNED